MFQDVIFKTNMNVDIIGSWISKINTQGRLLKMLNKESMMFKSHSIC